MKKEKKMAGPDEIGRGELEVIEVFGMEIVTELLNQIHNSE